MGDRKSGIYFNKFIYRIYECMYENALSNNDT